MPIRAGMSLDESRPVQNTIAKKTVNAWDDVMRPNRIMICSN